MRGTILAGGSGDAAAPDHAGAQQTTVPCVRQATMVFYPPVHADARRCPGPARDHHPEDERSFGAGLGTPLDRFAETKGANVFAYRVTNPEAYRVVDFDDTGHAVSLEEKPGRPRSNFAVPGLYFYDDDAVTIAQNLELSLRGEYEITDSNRASLDRGASHVTLPPRGTAWLDTGTFDSLNDAGNFVRAVEKRQGLKIGSPEEEAWRRGWLTR